MINIDLTWLARWRTNSTIKICLTGLMMIIWSKLLKVGLSFPIAHPPLMPQDHSPEPLRLDSTQQPLANLELTGLQLLLNHQLFLHQQQLHSVAPDLTEWIILLL